MMIAADVKADNKESPLGIVQYFIIYRHVSCNFVRYFKLIAKKAKVQYRQKPRRYFTAFFIQKT